MTYYRVDKQGREAQVNHILFKCSFVVSSCSKGSFEIIVEVATTNGHSAGDVAQLHKQTNCY